MRSRHRRDPPSLLTILRLIRRVQRAPEERDVLHDALLERYGDDYEESVQSALIHAYQDDKPYAVFVSPTYLADAEHGTELAASSRLARRLLPQVRRDPIPFQVRPLDYKRNIRYNPSRSMRRAVISFVAEPRVTAPEGRAYYIQGWERFRR